MNYEYIKETLERYFDCETTVEEETILRNFFRQENVPEELEQYKSLFAYINKEAEIELVENQQNNEITKQRKHVFSFAPLFRAAAVVAIILTLGNAINGAMKWHSEELNVEPLTEAEIEQTESNEGVALQACETVVTKCDTLIIQ